MNYELRIMNYELNKILYHSRDKGQQDDALCKKKCCSGEAAALRALGD